MLQFSFLSHTFISLNAKLCGSTQQEDAAINPQSWKQRALRLSTAIHKSCTLIIIKILSSGEL